MRRTSPGMASALPKSDAERSWGGRAMMRAMMRMAKSTHHLVHHTGTAMVIATEISASRTMRMERGISACWMVLSMKFRLP